MAEKLNEEQIAQALANFEGWTRCDGRDAIQKTFKFKDFKEAWSFMNACAVKAEEINHHPEWLNVYNKVEVTLSTHDIGGLSALDFKFAHFMDKYLATP